MYVKQFLEHTANSFAIGHSGFINYSLTMTLKSEKLSSTKHDCTNYFREKEEKQFCSKIQTGTVERESEH